MKSFITKFAVSLVMSLGLRPSWPDLSVFDNRFHECSENVLSIDKLQYLGEGGTGRVYTYLDGDSVYVAKYAKKGSEQKITNECDILQIIESSNIKNVERCICSVKDLSGETRSLLVPAFGTFTPGKISASFEDITDSNIRSNTALAIMDTIVNLAMIGIVSSDLQYLCNTESGEFIFIDFTEARNLLSSLKSPKDLSNLDILEIKSFVSEGINLIPSELQFNAIRHVLNEQKLDPSTFSNEPYTSIYRVIREQLQNILT